MKNTLKGIIILFLIPNLIISCAVNNAKFFSSIEQSTDPTHGYSADNPITIKNADLGKSINSCYYYLSRLRTSDDKKFLLIQRYSVDNPNFKKPALDLQNRYSGQPLNYGTGPLLDLYILKPENNQDTVRIYINPYLKGPIRIPSGLNFE